MSDKSVSKATTTLGLLVIRSDDMHQAAKFYTSLGMKFIKHSHPPCGEHYSTVGDDSVFEICQRKADQPPTTAAFFGLQVKDLEKALAATRKQHGTIIRSTDDSAWGRSAIIEDLDGHRVMLLEPLKDSA